jgi:DNA-binding GntR family transcriptional regulator
MQKHTKNIMTQDGDIKTATDIIVERIRQLIINRDFPAKTRLKNSELAARFGMSITPIREALNRLAKMGLVEYQARRGWEVKALDCAEIKGAYNLREYLERFAVRTICEHDESLVTLEQLLNEYKQILESSHLEMCVDSDLAFHTELIRLSHNKYAVEFMNQLMDIIYIGRSLEDYVENNTQCYEDHKAILHALTLRDADAAEACIAQHLRNCVS